VSVKAWLEGHEYDLQDLAVLLPTGETRVVKDGGGYYLTSTEIDDRAAGAQSYEVAPQMLERVNGIARAKHSRSVR